MLTIKAISYPFVFADGLGEALQIHFRDIEGDARIGLKLILMEGGKYKVITGEVKPPVEACSIWPHK